METLKKILLIGLGVTFILSAILKTISVYSFSQTVNSFCGLLGMDVLYGYGLPLAIGIIVFELLIGVCAFIRRFQRIIIWIYTIVLGFFTYITYINYTDLYGGIESCGCFGELIHFTPASSFYKNIALFVLSLILLGIHIIHIMKSENGYMVAEVDAKLLKVVNALGIHAINLGESIYNLSSETIPIYASQKGITPFYQHYQRLYNCA